MSSASTSSTPLLAKSPPCIVFTDWDGTVTLQDSNDAMTDNLGYGYDRRRFLNKEILEGRWSFRDAFADMLESIKTPFPECVEYLKQNVELDPGFKDFYLWATALNIPVVVVSSGMQPVIYALLENLLGKQAADSIPIVSNDVVVNKDGSWAIKFRDETDFGHDKSRAIRPYGEQMAKLPEDQKVPLFYCGDGVSDLSAAKETDLLFAKEGRDLVTYCEREKINFLEFNDFNDIKAGIQKYMRDAGKPLKE